jgi:hypothetical protein
MNRWKTLAVAVLLVPMIGALRAQDEPKGKSTDQRMPTYEPTKEHHLLKQFDGEWEFTAKCNMPGMEPSEGKGTETSHLGLGGFWLCSEEKGMMKDKEFNGQGFMGWNPTHKKFVGVWIDNQSPFIGKYVGEADSSGKVFTFKFMMSDEARTGKGAKEATGKEYGKEKETAKEMGKEMKCPDKMVHEIKDQDHRTLRFYGKDDSGKEQLWTEITYTRKPAMIK